jgi:hypothetical protein
MTSVSLHRAHNLQAVERLAQSSGYDERKLGHDDGKPYSRGQETRLMVYPLQNGRLCFTVFLKRRNLCEKLLRMMGSCMKQYGMWFVLLVAPKRPL